MVEIKCVDCGEVFVVTEEEKKWYEDKGFELPKRCKKCRAIKRGKNKNGKRD